MNDVPAPVDQFIRSLDENDIKRLSTLLATLRMVEGWCAVNRLIAKWLIYTAIAALVMVWKGYDALSHLWQAVKGH